MPVARVFISHTESDSGWVKHQLIPALTAAGLECHHEALFSLGKPRLLEFEEAIKQSDRVLLICSPAFFADESLQIVDLLAARHGEETKSWPVIPIIRHAVKLPLRLRILESLDATDQASWSDALTRLCRELKVDSPKKPKRPRCPYPGMRPFERDSEFPFYGRQDEVGKVIEQLRLHSFLAVIGPSGSGKSSLVHAGLIQELNKTELLGEGAWLISSFRPSQGDHKQSLVSRLKAHLGGQVVDPESAAASIESLLQVARGLTQPNDRQLLLVIDQFEEVYTLQQERDKKYRLKKEDANQFQQALLALSKVPNCYVVLTVRADFFGNLMDSPIWEKGVKNHRFDLPTLGQEAMRQAIVQPASDQDICIDQVLVERLLSEAGNEPGVLPFLQETMVRLWDRLDWCYLSVLDYESMVKGRRAQFQSGLEVAMAQQADAAISSLPDGKCDDKDVYRLVARRILLRLVQFGEGRLHTRRQQTVAQLSSAHVDEAIFATTLTHLTENRLLTIGDNRTIKGGPKSSGAQNKLKRDQRTVDIAHDKLITGWPTISNEKSGWIVQRRHAEETRRDLERKVARWIALGRKRFGGGLLDKIELTDCNKWIESDVATEIGEVPELKKLQKVSRQRLWLRRMGAISIPVLAIVAMGFWIWGVYGIAAEEAARADAEEKERAAAERLANAKSREQKTTQTFLEMSKQQLAGQYVQSGDIMSAARVLQTIPKESRKFDWFLTNRQIQGTNFTIQSRNVVDAIDVSPNGRILAGILQGERKEGRVATVKSGVRDPKALRPSETNFAVDVATRLPEDSLFLYDQLGEDSSTGIPSINSECFCLSFSPDGNLLAVGGLRDARVFSTKERKLVARIPCSMVMDVTFSRDSQRLLTTGVLVGNDSASIQQWTIDGRPAPGFTPIGCNLHSHAHYIFDSIIVFSFWQLGREEPLQGFLGFADAKSGEVIMEYDVGSTQINSLAVSPDGIYLAYSTNEGVVEYNLTTDEELGLVFEGDASGVAYSPDGASLAACLGERVLLRDVLGKTRQLMGHQGQVIDICFSKDGTKLYTSSLDSTIKCWDLRQYLRQPISNSNSATFHPNDSATIVYSEGSSLLSEPLFRNAKISRFDPGGPGLIQDILFNDSILAIQQMEKDEGDAKWVVSVVGLKGNAKRLATSNVRFSSMSFIGRDKLAACNSNLRVWDIHSGDLLKEIGGEFKWNGIHSSSKRLLTIHPESLRVWNTEDWTQEAVFRVKKAIGAISPDCKYVLATNSTKLNKPQAVPYVVASNNESRILKYDIAARSIAASVTFPEPIVDLEFTKDGTRVLAITKDSLVVLDTESLALLARIKLLEATKAKSISLNDESTLALIKVADGGQLLIDAREIEESRINRLASSLHDTPERKIAFSNIDEFKKVFRQSDWWHAEMLKKAELEDDHFSEFFHAFHLLDLSEGENIQAEQQLRRLMKESLKNWSTVNLEDVKSLHKKLGLHAQNVIPLQFFPRQLVSGFEDNEK